MSCAVNWSVSDESTPHPLRGGDDLLKLIKLAKCGGNIQTKKINYS